MTRCQVVNAILAKKEDLCRQVVNIVKEEHKDHKIDADKCVRDLTLIVEAIGHDTLNSTTENITKAGFSYIYYHNGFTFNRQRELVIYSVTVLRKLVIQEIPEEHDRLRILVNLKFDLLLSIIGDSSMRAVKRWDFAARVLPMSALGILFWTWAVGSDTWYHIFLTIIASTFFVVGVIWWWWALRKIGAIFVSLKRAHERFLEVQTELKDVSKEIKRQAKTVDKPK